MTFYCEEQWYLSEYNSDRHGFRNPDSILDSKNIDIVLVETLYWWCGHKQLLLEQLNQAFKW